MHTSTGILRYSHKEDYGYRLVAEVDQEISNYYRSLLPKWISAQRQKYGAHISIVRHEIPVNLDVWGKYEGQEVEFQYTNEVFFGKVYCWLNVFCKRLEEIRVEMGLPVSSPYTRPPEGFVQCFHCTIGNFKTNV